MAKALFLDRDGTINVDTGYVFEREKFVFLDGVFDFCRRAQGKGYLVIVITNQSGIARGYYTEADYAKLTDWMRGEFAAPRWRGPTASPRRGSSSRRATSTRSTWRRRSTSATSRATWRRANARASERTCSSPATGAKWRRCRN